MNGTNFIDGLNGLVLTYYLIVISLLFNLDLLNGINISDPNAVFLLLITRIDYFNLFNQFYLGDSGAYLLGLLMGYILIKMHEANPNICHIS